MKQNLLFQWIERVMLPFAQKVSAQRHIISIRDGFIAVMPFMIVGSFVLVFAYPPFSADSQFYLAKKWIYLATEYKDALLTPYNMTMGVMSVYICPSIAYCLAKNYQLPAINTAILALVSFLLIAGPVNSEMMISSSLLGGSGIFTAILVAVGICEMVRWLNKKDIHVPLPEQVPENIRRSFNQLIPLLIIVVTLFPFSLFIQHLFGMLIPQAIMNLFQPLLSASDSLFALIIAVLLTHLLWFAGIHGTSIVSGFFQAFWLTNLTLNQANMARGAEPTVIFVEPVWHFFVLIGGSGSTLGVVALYLISRSAHLRSIGKISIVPALFNINEPIIFGSPIVMNPLMFIPFIMAPTTNAIIAWYAIKYALVNHAFTLVPWTTPAFIGAAWATGWGISAIVLVFFLAFTSAMIYYPFIRAYEKQLTS